MCFNFQLLFASNRDFDLRLSNIILYCHHNFHSRTRNWLVDKQLVRIILGKNLNVKMTVKKLFYAIANTAHTNFNSNI